MSNRRLLDRQVSLLRHLTDPRVFFREVEGAPGDPDLKGLDAHRMRLAAQMSFNKRMAKIESMFPKTIQLLGDDVRPIVRAFADGYPPTSIGRYDNALQFRDHLSSRWRDYPPAPPYLPDVADYELAYAKVRSLALDLPAHDGPTDAEAYQVRRHPNAALVQLAHDVRSLFDEAADAPEVAEREVQLAITFADGAEHPRVFELPAQTFELLGTLDDWMAVEAGGETAALFRQLAELGMVEVQT